MINRIRKLRNCMNNKPNETPRRFRPGRLDSREWLARPENSGLENAVPFARVRENPLETLKNRLLREVLRALDEPALLVPVRRAANEAAALAWLEPFPLLVFPELFAEKVHLADGQARVQSRIRNDTARLLEVLS